jgi:hypothetical protein
MVRRFSPQRWADAVLDYSGTNAEEAVTVLESISEAFSLAPATLSEGKPLALPSGNRAAGELEKMLSRSLGTLSPDTGNAGNSGSGAAAAVRVAVLLTRRGLLKEIGAVARSTRREFEARTGLVRVLAETALPLDARQREQLRVALQRRTGAGELIVEEKIDPALLGGVRVLIGWERMDGTILKRLESLGAAEGLPARGSGAW